MRNKIIGWGVAALLVFFVATHPSEAASGVGKIGGGLLWVANGFSNFLSGLV